MGVEKEEEGLEKSEKEEENQENMMSRTPRERTSRSVGWSSVSVTDVKACGYLGMKRTEKKPESCAEFQYSDVVGSQTAEQVRSRTPETWR